jgi:hypothetical protein
MLGTFRDCKAAIDGIILRHEATELQAQLEALDEDSRLETAGWLMNLIGGADPSDRGQDSLTEAIDRGRELSSGKVQGLTREQFCDQLRHG